MRRVLLTIALLSFFVGNAWGTTYYMRAGGTAANKAAASGPCGTQANCMSIVTHDGETFSAGDIIYLCDDGGAYRDKIDIPSSGSSGSVITYEEASGDTAIIQGSDADDGSAGWSEAGGEYSKTFATEPHLVMKSDGTFLVMGTVGSLGALEWDYSATELYLGFDPLVTNIEVAQRMCIDTNDQDYLTFKDFTVRYFQETGIDVYDTSTNIIVDGVTFDSGYGRGLYLRGVDTATVQNCTFNNMWCKTGTGGIRGDGVIIKNGTSNSQDVTVTANTFGTQGVADGFHREAIFLAGCVNAVISNNTIYGGRHGIDVEPDAGLVVDGATISGNTINTKANTSAWGGTDFYIGISIDENAGTIQGTVIVTKNNINLNDEALGTLQAGIYIRDLDVGSGTFTFSENIMTGVKRGFDINKTISNPVTIKYNYITAGATLKNIGIEQYAANGEAIAQVDILYNIILDFPYGVDFNCGGTGTIEADVYSNVIDCEGSTFGLRVEDFTGNDATVKNNIFFGTPGTVYIQTDGSSPTIDIDHNCYEKSGGNYWTWQGTAKDFADWQTAGGDPNGPGQVDPLFINAAGGNFSLKPGSACRYGGDPSLTSYTTKISPKDIDWSDGVDTMEDILSIGAYGVYRGSAGM